MTIKTSDSSPIYVSWLPLPKDVVDVGARFGITFAPGKHATSKYSDGDWQRDLAKDLDRLVAVERVSDLVSLLPDEELRHLKIPDLIPEAQKRGIVVVRYPFVDGSTPSLALANLVVDDVLRRLRLGKSVVVHCQGGLGRAGCIGGCVLRALGNDADTALDVIAGARGKHAPETEQQKAFVRSFSRLPPPRSGKRPPPTPSAPTTTTTTLPLNTETVAQRALRDSFRGAVIGAAIGDALGHPTEFMKMPAIHKKYGPEGVKGFELYWNRAGKRFAPYTDDTQMAEQVLRSLLEARDNEELELESVMEIMGRRFIEWSIHPQGGHRAPGNACIAGCRMLAKGVDWSVAGGETAGGCGSVMRAYPFGLMFHDDVDDAIDYAVAHSALTHRDPIALAACAAMAVGVARQVHGADVISTALEMIAVARRFSEPTALMMARALGEARDDSVDADDVFERLQSWAAHEAIAAAVYLLVKYPDNAAAAVLHGANTPGDSDSIATLAGALLGARLGLGAFPSAWIDDVERSEELLALADLIIDGGPPDDVPLEDDDGERDDDDDHQEGAEEEEEEEEADVEPN
jgi:ADP-ribosylglycohydrolase/protein-tyrosine phosphatase